MARLGRAARVRSERGPPAPPALAGTGQYWTLLPAAAYAGASSPDSRSAAALHMHLLVELHGQPGWAAALTPLSVDGMIVAVGRSRTCGILPVTASNMAP